MLMLPALLLMLPAQEAVETPENAPQTAEISKALEELAKSGNYSFKITTLESGTPQAGGGRAGGRGQREEAEAPADAAAPPPAPEPVVLKGHVQKDLPIHFIQGGTEAWRSAEGVLTVRNAEGWSVLDRRAMRGGRGQRGADAGGEQDWAAMRAQMGLLRARAAHQHLDGLADKLEAASRTQSEGKIRFMGTLTDAGAASFAGGQRGRGGRGGRGGQGDAAPALTTTGTFEVVLSAEGVLQSVTLETEQSGQDGERKIERKRKTVIEVSAVGTTELEVPEEVRTRFAEAAAARAEDQARPEEF